MAEVEHFVEDQLDVAVVDQREEAGWRCRMVARLAPRTGW
jgi:hypothetical protein